MSMASCHVLSVSWRFTFWPETLGATTMSTRPEAERALNADRISILEKLKFWRCVGPPTGWAADAPLSWAMVAGAAKSAADAAMKAEDSRQAARPIPLKNIELIF